MQPLLDAVAVLSAQPGRHAAGRRRQSQEDATPKRSRKPDPDEPFCGLVFKIDADKHGDLHFVRVYSGVLKANSRVLNPGKDKKENVAAALAHPGRSPRAGRQRSRPATSSASSACGTRSPATRCATPQHPILLESIEFPETVISMAIEPESSAERKKLADTLEMLKRQDPTFRAAGERRDRPDADQRHGRAAPGSDQAPAAARLQPQRAGSQAARQLPRDGRAARPRSSANAIASRAGSRCSPKVTIRIEPYPTRAMPAPSSIAGSRRRAAGAYLSTSCSKSSTNAGHGGGLLGFPLMRLKITVLGGEVHETESNEIAFRIAAADAFNKALQAAGTVLLEPIMKLEITTPEEHLGDFVSDLQQRRAIITHTQHRGQQHGDRGRGAAGQPVRLFQRHARPEPGPGHLLDGAGRLRPGTAGSGCRVSCKRSAISRARCRLDAHPLRVITTCDWPVSAIADRKPRVEIRRAVDTSGKRLNIRGLPIDRSSELMRVFAGRVGLS